MKEAFFAISAVLVVSALALGVILAPSSTGNSVWQSPMHVRQIPPSFDWPMSPGQYSPAQYSYYTPTYPYATALNQCLYQVPCRVESKECLTRSAVFVDGSRMGCAQSTQSTQWCGAYKIGWNGGSECSAQDSNTLTQCVCP